MASQFDRFAGIPESDTYWNRIELCRVHGGVSEAQLTQALNGVGISQAQVKSMRQARTARDLTPDINKKMQKVMERLAARAGTTVMYLNFGWMAGESRVPEFAKKNG